MKRRSQRDNQMASKRDLKKMERRIKRWDEKQDQKFALRKKKR